MKRRKAREHALQFLYRIDFMNLPKGHSGDRNLSWLDNDIKAFWSDINERDAEVISFSEDIISGTIKNLDEIDSIIQKVAKKWKLSRIAAIDRNILRFATYELLFRPDIPESVTINEALEIAKIYSTSESASFINGILDRIAKEYSHKPK